MSQENATLQDLFRLPSQQDQELLDELKNDDFDLQQFTAKYLECRDAFGLKQRAYLHFVLTDPSTNRSARNLQILEFVLNDFCAQSHYMSAIGHLLKTAISCDNTDAARLICTVPKSHNLPCIVSENELSFIHSPQCFRLFFGASPPYTLSTKRSIIAKHIAADARVFISVLHELCPDWIKEIDEDFWRLLLVDVGPVSRDSMAYLLSQEGTLISSWANLLKADFRRTDDVAENQRLVDAIATSLAKQNCLAALRELESYYQKHSTCTEHDLLLHQDQLRTCFNGLKQCPSDREAFEFLHLSHDLRVVNGLHISDNDDAPANDGDPASSLRARGIDLLITAANCDSVKLGRLALKYINGVSATELETEASCLSLSPPLFTSSPSSSLCMLRSLSTLGSQSDLSPLASTSTSTSTSTFTSTSTSTSTSSSTPSSPAHAPTRVPNKVLTDIVNDHSIVSLVSSGAFALFLLLDAGVDPSCFTKVMNRFIFHGLDNINDVKRLCTLLNLRGHSHVQQQQELRQENAEGRTMSPSACYSTIAKAVEETICVIDVTNVTDVTDITPARYVLPALSDAESKLAERDPSLLSCTMSCGIVFTKTIHTNVQTVLSALRGCLYASSPCSYSTPSVSTPASPSISRSFSYGLSSSPTSPPSSPLLASSPSLFRAPSSFAHSERRIQERIRSLCQYYNQEIQFWWSKWEYLPKKLAPRVLDILYELNAIDFVELVNDRDPNAREQKEERYEVWLYLLCLALDQLQHRYASKSTSTSTNTRAIRRPDSRARSYTYIAQILAASALRATSVLGVEYPSLAQRLAHITLYSMNGAPGASMVQLCADMVEWGLNDPNIQSAGVLAFLPEASLHLVKGLMQKPLLTREQLRFYCSSLQTVSGVSKLNYFPQPPRHDLLRQAGTFISEFHVDVLTPVTQSGRFGLLTIAGMEMKEEGYEAQEITLLKFIELVTEGAYDDIIQKIMENKKTEDEKEKRKKKKK